MFIYCIRTFIIAICICCLFTMKFTLRKISKKIMYIRMIMIFLFLVLEISSILLQGFNPGYEIVRSFRNLLTCFIVIVLFNKKEKIKKILLSIYVCFVFLKLILNINNINLTLDYICNLIILISIFETTIFAYYKEVYNKYNKTNAKLHRLKINTKIYNTKLDDLKEKNIKKQNFLNQSMDNFKKSLLAFNTEIYFIDQTLNYVYQYTLEEDKICRINRDIKEKSVNLIILEKFYNTLYNCEDCKFEIKNGENGYYYYKLYPNILLEGTLGVLFVKTEYKNNLNHENKQNYIKFKKIVENMPYDIILEKDNKIVYKNKESIYYDNMMNIILDKNIKGNVAYSADGKDEYKFYIDRIEFENKNDNLIILKNISEQKSLVDKINLAKQKYELFVDILSEGVFVLDHNNNKIKYTNKSFDQILQKYKLSIVDMYDLIKNSDLNYCDTSFNMKFESKKIANSLNEDVYLDFANMVLSINQKNIMIGVFRDITAEVKNNILQKKMEEEAYLKKLKNEFLINLSHELKTPVNLIYLKNQLTKSICEKNNIVEIEKVNLLNKELKNIRILMNLIDNLIALEKLNLESYDDNRNCYNIVEILENVVIKLNKYKDVDIVFDTNEEEIFTFLDPYNIIKVITRLISIMYKCSDNQQVINFDINKKRRIVNIHIYYNNDNLKKLDDKEIEIIDTSILLCKLVLNLYNGNLEIKDNFKDINIQLESMNNKENNYSSENKLIEDNFIEQEFAKIYNL